MPLQQTSGAASYDAFGGGAPVAAKYIEDFFQTWLRTGTGSSTTVTTGLNASINKSLVWTKSRSATTNHKLTDTARGVTKALSSNTTGAEVTDSQGLTAFSSTGYTIGTNTDYNNNGATYVDWQWVATPKFFDVVTYTGTGSVQNIAHNLGSVPGCIIVKDTTNAGSAWAIYHTSLGNTQFLQFTTSAAGTSSGYWNNTTPTSTQFTVGTNGNVNQSGATFVAYLFAHNAGGFGLSGTDNVISCGSFTTDGAGAATVSLGYEPQWVMTKSSSGTSAWRMFDTMRGLTVAGQNDALLQAQSSAAEITNSDYCSPTATGFTIDGHSGSETHIYIAIRRGPMRTPTTGTSVFSPNTQTGAGTSAGQTITTNFPVDLEISSGRSDNSGGNAFVDRLRGGQNYIQATNTNAEVNFTSWTPLIGFANNTGITDANYGSTSASYVAWNFRRAPGFFDVVCYTGNSTGGRTVAHNLAVAPELMIVKSRSIGGTFYDWAVYSKQVGATKYLWLNSTNLANPNDEYWQDTDPTASVFSLGNGSRVNSSGQTYVAYLFASVPGVSKVGTYTGTGTTQLINCGFTGGARFVLIKRTDSTGDWYVWDSARGIVAGNDPYLLLNSTAAEVTSTDFVDTAATGFELSSTAPAALNASGGSYIFLAIA